MENPCCSCELTRVAVSTAGSISKSISAGTNADTIALMADVTSNVLQAAMKQGTVDDGGGGPGGGLPPPPSAEQQAQVPHNTDCPRHKHGPNHLGLRCTARPRPSNGPNHLGSCAPQAQQRSAVVINIVDFQHRDLLHKLHASPGPSGLWCERRG